MWNKDGDTVTDQQIDVQREIDMMKSLQHPNICRLLEHFWNADGSFGASPLCPFCGPY